VRSTSTFVHQLPRSASEALRCGGGLMASAQSLKILRELQSRPENKVSGLNLAPTETNECQCTFLNGSLATSRGPPVAMQSTTLGDLLAAVQQSYCRMGDAVQSLRCAGLCRLRGEASAVGDGIIWHVHVPGLQWKTPRPGRAHLLCQVLPDLAVMAGSCVIRLSSAGTRPAMLA
jgi:hypothetical protein